MALIGLEDELMVVDAAGALKVYRGDSGGTLLGTATSGLTSGVVHYVEFEVSIHDSTGSATVTVDDVEVLALVSQDTQNGGTPAIDGIRFGGGSTGSVIGDLYVVDPLDGVAPITILGADTRVDVCLPTATASPSQWTAIGGSKPAVVADEETVVTSDYVTTTTDGDIDQYRVTAISHNPEAIHAVRVSAYARKVSGTSASLAARLVPRDYDTIVATPVALTGSWARAETVINSEDVTGSGPLLQDGINTMYFGFQAEI
jgi:hypothetical protein